MFKKKGPAETENFERVDTLIGKDTLFEGMIKATGTVRIDGEYKGEIKTKGDLVIGESGKVEANIDARNVLIGGTIKGNINANGKVDIAPTGKLFGDMRVKNLLIEVGAIFKGNCTMDKEDLDKSGEKARDNYASQGPIKTDTYNSTSNLR